jgi:methyl-accepting chemotaxis protein WspA
MKVALKHKIIGITVLAAVLPIAVLSGLLSLQERTLTNTLTDDAKANARQEASQVSQLVYRMCELCNQTSEQRLKGHLEAATAEFHRLGPVSFSTNRITWNARNQNTNTQAIPVSLPVMMIGNKPVTLNREFETESPVVDIVTKFTGGLCTIFQRMNPEGDMLRVATTVPNADGKRGIETYLPRRLADGQENPVLACALRGQTYTGRANALGQWHAACYQPIWDSEAKKEVVGLLCVGFNLDDMSNRLRETIRNIRVGKSGYVYVLYGSGEQRGQYVVAKDRTSDGTNIWESKDASGNYLVQTAILKALQTTNGVPDFERYLWQNKDETAPRMKVVGLTYFAPWDWVIGAGIYEDDYRTMLVKLQAAVGRLLLTGPIGGGIALVLVLVLALVLAQAAVRPITKVIEVTQIIADGNLAQAGTALEGMKMNLNGRGADEPAQLFAAVSLMTQRLGSLVGQVQRSCVSLVSTATEIAAASRQQETTVSEFGASTHEVTAAVKEISATSQELAKTMDDVKRAATATETFADSGRAGLGGMEASMRQLADATAAISGRLAIINEKANNINSMVTTITKVADQTNLLSLNASIEAEKAGEYGLGFAVVAREIRRLADQTAVASLEIEQTVREMQSSVNAGVMEMDKFSGEVTQGVKSANEISAQMGRIIEQVKVLLPRFDTVNDGMRSQAEGARQISEAMSQLSAGARDASESLKQFKSATEQLKESARTLQQETSRFKV